MIFFIFLNLFLILIHPNHLKILKTIYYFEVKNQKIAISTSTGSNILFIEVD